MLTNEKNPLAGVDTVAAASELSGPRPPVLEVDWLARDADGRYAVFLGDESSRAPAAADDAHDVEAFGAPGYTTQEDTFDTEPFLRVGRGAALLPHRPT